MPTRHEGSNNLARDAHESCHRLGLGDRDTDALRSEGAHDEPGGRECLRSLGRRFPCRQPHEIAVRDRHRPPLRAQLRLHLVASGREHSHLLEQLSLVIERRVHGALSGLGDRERNRGAACRLHDGRVRDRVAGAQPGEAIGLRKGAQHDEVRVAPDEGRAVD